MMERNIMNSAKLLAVVVVLLGLILIGQWTSSGGNPAIAQPIMGDSGARQLAAVDELKSINAKLDKLIGILEGGQVQVRLATPDETKKTAPAR
jgi:hypothetical protein